MVNPYPFEQQKISENVIIRKFSETVDEEDLQWHFDEEDRWIEVLETTDWQFQFDNQLPQVISDKIFIPAGVYHRIIKGTKDFTVKIQKNRVN